jgi:hypothetical protein
MQWYDHRQIYCATHKSGTTPLDFPKNPFTLVRKGFPSRALRAWGSPVVDTLRRFRQERAMGSESC